MRQESAVALGKAEAERWVMDRNRSGRSTAGAGKAALDVIQVAAEQIARQMERKQSASKGAGMAAGQPALGSENRKGHGPKFS